MRILLTGAGGFVGGALLKRLAGHDLVLPSRQPEKLRAPGLKGVFPVFNEDLETLVRMQRPDVVINLLGIISEAKGETFEKVHFGYTRALVSGARLAGVKRFIQMSALGAELSSPSGYQASKARAEGCVKESGLDYVIFRPSLITGPGQKLFLELGELAPFVPFFAAPADAWAAPVNLEDAADCFARAALNGLPSGTYELAGEEKMSYAELFRKGLAAGGVRKPVLGLPRRFFYPLLPFFALLPKPPMTREHYLMLASPNVPSGRYPGVREILGSVRPAF
jgi:NADH dehydrogenase